MTIYSLDVLLFLFVVTYNRKKNVKKNIQLNHFAVHPKLTQHYQSTVLQQEKAMAPHSSTLAWKIPWTEGPGGLQSMGSLGVGHDWATLTFHFHALEKAMATHSSVLAWRIPGTGEPGGLPSMGSHRVRHDWSDAAAAVLQQKLFF